MSGDISNYLIHQQKDVYIGHIKNTHDPLYRTAATKKSCRGKMPYMIAVGQSLMASVCQSVSQNWSIQQFDIS